MTPVPVMLAVSGLLSVGTPVLALTAVMVDAAPKPVPEIVWPTSAALNAQLPPRTSTDAAEVPVQPVMLRATLLGSGPLPMVYSVQIRLVSETTSTSAHSALWPLVLAVPRATGL